MMRYDDFGKLMRNNVPEYEQIFDVVLQFGIPNRNVQSGDSSNHSSYDSASRAIFA
jgi:hypothetical protein